MAAPNRGPDPGLLTELDLMPANGPQTVLAVEKLVGNAPHPINLAGTYTNSFAIAANKLEGYTK
jgi:NitT/TauT family transport system substrate-binding protein